MSTISFVSTSNPNPDDPQSVTWTVQTSDSSDIDWTVEEGNPAIPIVQLLDASEGGGRSCKITPTGHMGSAVITASVGDSVVSRTMAVTSLWAYYKKNANNQTPTSHEAPSHQWNVVDDPTSEGIVPLATMKDSEGNDIYGMAYMQPQKKLVFNSAYMHNLHSQNDGTAIVYYSASTDPQSTNPALLTQVFTTYVYAPDGTLWKIPSGEWLRSDPTNMPNYNQMQVNNAALAWGPPNNEEGQQSSQGQSQSVAVDTDTSVVMCFILDQCQLAAVPGSTTYYTFNRKTDTEPGE